jgi:hypothetical protein
MLESRKSPDMSSAVVQLSALWQQPSLLNAAFKVSVRVAIPTGNAWGRGCCLCTEALQLLGAAFQQLQLLPEGTATKSAEYVPSNS